MMTLKQFIYESLDSTLTVFDLDDTLFTSGARIKVMHRMGQRVLKYLTPSQFNNYKLLSGQTFDFSEFRDPHVFAKTAKPIDKIFKRAKAMLGSGNNRVVIVTARADFTDKGPFLDMFRSHGFDVDKSHVYRAGNIPGDGPKAKQTIIRSLIEKGSYTRVRMYDDAAKNLDAFLELEDEFPKISFWAYLASHDGSTARYQRQGAEHGGRSGVRI